MKLFLETSIFALVVLFSFSFGDLEQNGECYITVSVNTTNQTLKACCNGHTYDSIAKVCNIPCDDCEHGRCFKPNDCTCFDGYFKGPNGKCISKCPMSCWNGKCKSLLYFDECQCDKGYILAPNGIYCVPICVGGCGEGGSCYQPNKCKCKPGYKINSSGKCQKCPPGYCLPPSPCPKGYKLLNNTCVPTCLHECHNGGCISPNVCGCLPGWNLDFTYRKCEPVCEFSCTNGKCVLPNTCQCHKGYTNDELNPFLCVPFCSDGCPNGQCISPELCACNYGFIKNPIGSNNCVPTE